jgi:hypothetical protein
MRCNVTDFSNGVLYRCVFPSGHVGAHYDQVAGGNVWCWVTANCGSSFPVGYIAYPYSAGAMDNINDVLLFGVCC